MPLTPSEIVAELRQAGHRITIPRRWIVSVLYESGGHLTIEDIHRQLVAENVSVDEATVYRTVQWLKSEGYVAQTDIGQGADVYSLIADTRHHHLVCLNCGVTIEASDSIFDSLRGALLNRYGFEARIDHFAIFGMCPHCLKDTKNADQAD